MLIYASHILSSFLKSQNIKLFLTEREAVNAPYVTEGKTV